VAADALRIVVKGTNLPVTDALREYAEKRVSKVAKYFPNEQNIHVEVVLRIERNQQIAEVTVHVRSLVVRAESRTNDMYASIDACVDRVGAQVRRYKTRLQKRFQEAPREALQAAADAASEPEVEDELPAVVRRKRFQLKPMSVDEALMQMELLGHDFFVFVNAASDQVNVLYRRNDGNVGLLEPEYA
jgi:putative sigma-54 modulation protein